ncbi:MAG: glucose-1-phosphate thymidylyltransferase [Patescibacteria group bacterium]
MKAIIAAGGKGTRLYPLTFTSNKHMLPIANKPLLLYSFEDIVRVGIKEIGIIVNEARPSIENLFGDGSKWGVKITYIDQFVAKGLAHVVKISEQFINGDSFVYHLGDNIFTKGIKKPFDKFKKIKPDALLTIIEHDENYRLGVPFFDDKGKLVRVVEKPKNPPNRFGIPGLYMFSPKVFEAFQGKDAIKPSPRGELEIVDLYNYMLKKGYKVEVAELEGQWRDPGKFDDSLEANKLLMDLDKRTEIKGSVDKNSKLSDGVVLGKGSKVINSQIVGPVRIGNNVEIRNSYIGPYTAIGSDCQLVNCKVEYSILLEDVNIVDVKGKIEASIIGKHTEIRQTKERIPRYSFIIADHCRIDLPF